MRRAPQQLATKQLLEAADLPAERRLRDVEPIGGAAEVELLGDRDERPQMTELDSVWSLREREQVSALVHWTSMVAEPPSGDAERA